MKKVSLVIGLVFIIIILIFSYKHNSGENIPIINVEDGYDPRQDSSVVMAWDADGKVIVDREAELGTSTPLVNSSLNGEVFYRMESKGPNQIKTEVFKYKYRQEDFIVSFNNDTVSKSNPFKATIYFPFYKENKYSFEVLEENAYEVEKQITKDGVRFIYKMKSSDYGINKFEGILKAKGKIHPIKFNYIVN